MESAKKKLEDFIHHIETGKLPDAKHLGVRIRELANAAIDESRQTGDNFKVYVLPNKTEVLMERGFDNEAKSEGEPIITFTMYLSDVRITASFSYVSEEQRDAVWNKDDGRMEFMQEWYDNSVSMIAQG